MELTLDNKEWLEDIAAYSTSTLALLNRKAEKSKQISDGDQVMSEICIGYLYLLHTLNTQGILETKSIGNALNRTVH